MDYFKVKKGQYFPFIKSILFTICFVCIVFLLIQNISLQDKIKNSQRELDRIDSHFPIFQPYVDLKQIDALVVNDVNGHKVFLHPNDSNISANLIKHNGFFDPHINHILEKVAFKGAKTLNLGANLGIFTLKLAQLVGREGMVYAFEASPFIFKLLERSVKANDYKNIELFNVAAYSSKTELNFLSPGASYAQAGNVGGGAIIDNDVKKSYPDLYVVHAERVDDVLSKVDAIDIMLLDIDGSEPEAVKGMKSLIDRSPNLLVIHEWHVEMMAKFTDVESYIKFWQDRGFVFLGFNHVTEKLKIMKLTDLLSPHVNVWDVVITRNPEKYMHLVNN